jgi:glutamyl-tRNA reductase
VSSIIDAEVERTRKAYPPEIVEIVQKSLHRVTGAMLHHPSVAAVELAQIGRMDDYNQALQTLFGIRVEA